MASFLGPEILDGKSISTSNSNEIQILIIMDPINPTKWHIIEEKSQNILEGWIVTESGVPLISLLLLAITLKCLSKIQIPCLDRKKPQ